MVAGDEYSEYPLVDTGLAREGDGGDCEEDGVRWKSQPTSHAT